MVVRSPCGSGCRVAHYNLGIMFLFIYAVATYEITLAYDVSHRLVHGAKHLECLDLSCCYCIIILVELFSLTTLAPQCLPINSSDKFIFVRLCSSHEL